MNIMEVVTNNGMCRCCASEGTFKDVSSKYLWMGEEEVYADMLRQCFDIALSPPEDGYEGGICEVCITQLRNAANFKKQVLRTEEQFKHRIHNKMFTENLVKVEVGPIEDDANLSDNDNHLSEDFSSPEFDIKTESPEEPKSKKRTKGVSTRAKKPKLEDAESSTKRIGRGDNTVTEIEGSRNILNKVQSLALVKNTAVVSKEKGMSVIRLVIQSDAGVESNIIADHIPTINLRKKKIRSRSHKPESLEKYTRPLPNYEHVKILKKFPEMSSFVDSVTEILLFTNATPFRRRARVSMGYTCCYCDIEYADPADLKTHTMETHIDTNFRRLPIHSAGKSNVYVRLDITGLMCRLCDIPLENYEAMFEHLLRVHKKKSVVAIKHQVVPFDFGYDELTCCICDQVKHSFNLLAEHMNTHFRNFVCEICDIGFVTARKMKNHLESHQGGSFSCRICNKVFQNEKNRRSHENAVHINKKSLHRCGHCFQSFPLLRLKREHLRDVHNVDMFVKCQACDKSFVSLGRLTAHIKRDHLMERTNECQFCDKAFFSKKELSDHMTTHTGEKNFTCPICSQAFAKRYTLIEHRKRIHKDIKSLKCDYCSKMFMTESMLQRHLNSKHKVDDYD